MVDRIREILNARQLTPTQFADTIGVARPIISHILSGRNKPSLEVVQKIVAAFPDLSLNWLLKGIGAMSASSPATNIADTSSEDILPRRTNIKASETARPAPNKARTQPTMQPNTVEPTVNPPEALYEGRAPSASANPPIKEAQTLPLFSIHTAAHPNNSQCAVPPSVTAQVALTEHKSTASNQAVADKPVASADVPAAATNAGSVSSIAQPFAEPGKVIRRIVIFYQDGTFTDYQPDNK